MDQHVSTLLFTKNFLRCNRDIVESENVLEVYPVWSAYLSGFLSRTWPKEWSEYKTWVSEQHLCVGLETEDFGELGRFVSEASFSACMHGLCRLHRKVGFGVVPICKLASDGEDSYRVVGNVLWPTQEFKLEWHITKDVDVAALWLD
jgi:hypothetical protein